MSDWPTFADRVRAAKQMIRYALDGKANPEETLAVAERLLGDALEAIGG